MKLFHGKGFHVIFENESEELHRAMECLLQCHSCLRVSYEERIDFLTPFVHLLMSRSNGHGLHGVRSLATCLHLLLDFMNADGSEKTLSSKSIEDEIYKLHSLLYPKG